MAPLIRRLHLFEIDDQSWFPDIFRKRVQAALTLAWDSQIPYLFVNSPARIAAKVLKRNLGESVKDHVFIDFCAGGGGPTPSIERALNKDTPWDPVRFVLTDLHPHTSNWAAAAAASPNIHYVAHPVDAARAPAGLTDDFRAEGKKVFRLFNLAFHHFDDSLARAILKNTVETSDGFAIFELQDRTLAGLVVPAAFGIGIFLSAFYYAVIWRSPITFIFSYMIPILPFVLVVDGWVSALRTRTPEEVGHLLRTCGAEGGVEELSRWELKSGHDYYSVSIGYVNWIVCRRMN